MHIARVGERLLRLQIQFRISRSFRPRNLANLGSKIRFWIRRKEHTLSMLSLRAVQTARYGYARLCTAVYGYARHCTTMGDNVRLCTTMHGYIWPSAMNGYVRLCTAMHNYAWLSPAINSYILLCMAM